MDKIHVYTMTWNEAYMIKYFLRYYETIADKIFVIDDNSNDGTQEIIKACSKAILLPYPCTSGFKEPDKTRCLTSEYKKYSRDAEWVIIVDCDEFVVYQLGNLRDYLINKRVQGCRAIKTCGYFLASKEIPNTERQLFDAMPYNFRKRQWDKSIVFDPKLDTKFEDGCHKKAYFSEGVVANYNKLAMYHCCWLSKQWIIDHYNKRISRMTDENFKKDFISKLNFYLRKTMVYYDSIVK